MFEFLAKKKPVLSRDDIIRLLKTNPEALAAFEATYQTRVLNEEDIPDNFFKMNSRQAVQEARDAQALPAPVDLEQSIQAIVEELAAQTKVYIFDGDLNLPGRIEQVKALPAADENLTSKETLMAIPAEHRPQLTGSLMTRDMPNDAAPEVLFFYKKFQEEQNQKKKASAYHHFRQGLDIMDLDPLLYAIIDQNKNSMGHWLPTLVDACMGQDFLKIPATRIVKVPLTLLQLTRVEYQSLTPTTREILNRWAMRVFDLDESKDYFIKTGTYSSKFDFRNAKVTGAQEVRELGEYLLFIHFQALQMASPLAQPCIYGASTTTEWVVRDFIADKENNPCIYKGLPLHTEYRVFVDTDTDEVIGISPYWEPDTMKKHFEAGAGSNVHDAHDYAVYKAHEETLMGRYHANKDAVIDHIREILPKLDLSGQWSIDVMQNGDEFYIIDMALAEQSAFYKCVPEALRRPSKENWLPMLGK